MRDCLASFLSVADRMHSDQLSQGDVNLRLSAAEDSSLKEKKSQGGWFLLKSRPKPGSWLELYLGLCKRKDRVLLGFKLLKSHLWIPKLCIINIVKTALLKLLLIWLFTVLQLCDVYRRTVLQRGTVSKIINNTICCCCLILCS